MSTKRRKRPMVDTSASASTVESVVHDTHQQQEGEDSGGVIILQCANCRTVVGDSTSLIHAWQPADDKHFVTIGSASSIQASEELLQSAEIWDLGCTFHSLSCVACSFELGLSYRTTTTSLDAIRGAYSLDVSRIITYTIGSGSCPPGSLGESALLTIPQVWDRMERVISLLVQQMERIETLEHRVSDSTCRSE